MLGKLVWSKIIRIYSAGEPFSIPKETVEVIGKLRYLKKGCEESES
jgi:hypothetical protein